MQNDATKSKITKQMARDALKEIVKANPEYTKKIKELRITL